MATIEANLNDVEAWGGEIVQLPPGEYSVKVKSADVEQKEKDGKVTNQLVVDYEVISGAFAGKVCKAWFNMDFSQDTPRKRMKSLVNACNIPLSGNGSFDSNQLVGCKLNIDIIHRTYEGKPDPILGGPPPVKTAVNAINERTYREVVNQPAATSAPTNAKPASVPMGATLPGLTPSR